MKTLPKSKNGASYEMVSAKVIICVALLLLSVFSSSNVKAQAPPEAIPYITVAIDPTGALAANQKISVRFSILDVSATGVVLYCETQFFTATSSGQVNVNIGQGTVVSGVFSNIPWGSGPKFLKIEMDSKGGTKFSPYSNSQLMSVPYALFAKSSADLPKGTAAGNTLHWNGTKWVADSHIYNNGGNVGIGTNTPSALLHVFAGSNAEVRIQSDPNPLFGPSTLSFWSDAQGSPSEWRPGYIRSGDNGTFTGRLDFFTNGTGLGSNTGSVLGLSIVNGQVKIPGGNPGVGKLLTSDANGLTSWTSPAASGLWSLTGNAGTDPSVNFIGTTDDHPLKFKVDNQPAGYISSGITAVGMGALSSNSGIDNSAFGRGALSTNTAASFNSAFGEAALTNNTVGGENNSAFGALALYYNTIGQENCAFGVTALNTNTDGSDNSAFGYSVLNGNTGDDNSAFGAKAIANNFTGSENCAFGANALEGNTTGRFNVAMGFETLIHNDSGSFNTIIGYRAGPWEPVGSPNNTTNLICLGANTGSIFSKSNTVELGNGSITDVFSAVSGFSSYSDARIKDNVKANVPGLAFINHLRPVTYNLNIHRENEMLYKVADKASEIQNKNNANNINISQQNEIPKKRLKAVIERNKTDEWSGKYDIEKITQTGFIAQEVDQAAKEAGYDFNGVKKPANKDGLYALNYTEFIMPLVKSVQELSAKNDSLTNVMQPLQAQNVQLQSDLKAQQIQIGSQQKQMDELKSTVNNLQSFISKTSSPMNEGTATISINNESNTSLLGQNIPNPADNNTVIPFRIPKNCNSASIVISEAGTGRIIRAIPVSCNETQLAIDAGNLASGTYAYSLYIDGKIVDTKQMVLTK